MGLVETGYNSVTDAVLGPETGEEGKRKRFKTWEELILFHKPDDTQKHGKTLKKTMLNAYIEGD